MHIEIGQLAPAFKLYDSQKQLVSLSDYSGKNVLLLFFPLAFTSVCTAELCSVRDNIALYSNMNSDVLGISVDSLYTLAAFKKEQQLNFPLLSDYRRQVVNKYGILMKNLGPLADYDAAKRSIFILDKDQRIQYRWVSDNPLIEPNYEEIKQVLKTL